MPTASTRRRRWDEPPHDRRGDGRARGCGRSGRGVRGALPPPRAQRRQLRQPGRGGPPSHRRDHGDPRARPPRISPQPERDRRVQGPRPLMPSVYLVLFIIPAVALGWRIIVTKSKNNLLRVGGAAAAMITIVGAFVVYDDLDTFEFKDWRGDVALLAAISSSIYLLIWSL